MLRQAYTVELEAEINQLKEEHKQLRRALVNREPSSDLYSYTLYHFLLLTVNAFSFFVWCTGRAREEKKATGINLYSNLKAYLSV